MFRRGAHPAPSLSPEEWKRPSGFCPGESRCVCVAIANISIGEILAVSSSLGEVGGGANIQLAHFVCHAVIIMLSEFYALYRPPISLRKHQQQQLRYMAQSHIIIIVRQSKAIGKSQAANNTKTIRARLQPGENGKTGGK